MQTTEFDEILVSIYHSPAMLAKLPNLIDPILLADRNASIEGELLLSGFDRVADLLANDRSHVDVTLRFTRDGKIVTVIGHIDAVLELKCQRCLEAVEWVVDSDFRLAVVNSLERANNLPEGYEPLLLLLEDEKILLKDIIEDELLLNLPSIPKHQNDCAIPKISNKKPELLSKLKQVPTENPFSILADLKNLETYNGSTKE